MANQNQFTKKIGYYRAEKLFFNKKKEVKNMIFNSVIPLQNKIADYFSGVEMNYFDYFCLSQKDGKLFVSRITYNYDNLGKLEIYTYDAYKKDDVLHIIGSSEKSNEILSYKEFKNHNFTSMYSFEHGAQLSKLGKISFE